MILPIKSTSKRLIYILCTGRCNCADYTLNQANFIVKRCLDPSKLHHLIKRDVFISLDSSQVWTTGMNLNSPLNEAELKFGSVLVKFWAIQLSSCSNFEVKTSFFECFSCPCTGTLAVICCQVTLLNVFPPACYAACVPLLYMPTYLLLTWIVTCLTYYSS
jgi:hypothetical protein